MKVDLFQFSTNSRKFTHINVSVKHLFRRLCPRTPTQGEAPLKAKPHSRGRDGRDGMGANRGKGRDEEEGRGG